MILGPVTLKASQGIFLGPTTLAASEKINTFGVGSITLSTYTPIQGDLITSTHNITDADGMGAITFSWLRDGVPIAGAAGANYTPTVADIGSTLSLQLRYTDGLGFDEVHTSTATSPVTPEVTPPVISLIGDAVVTLIEGDSYVDAGANVSDNIDADAVLVGSGVVDTSTVGQYQVSYDYTDAAGNAADTVIRTVNVLVDPTTIKPVLTLNGPSRVFIALDSVYHDAGATMTDNIDGSATIHALETVDSTILGIQRLNYNYTDSHGNAAVAISREVVVVSVSTGGLSFRPLEFTPITY